MEKNGYIRPKMQKSSKMIVISDGFNYDYRQNKRVDMTYYITIKFTNLSEVIGNYLMVEFQDPEKLDRFYKYIRPILKDDKVMHIESQKLYGFKNMKSYLIKVSIVNNNNGDKILDSIEQYTRVEYIPGGWKNAI